MGGVVLHDLNSLPEDCISTVLSLTSPLDASRLSLLSSSFRSAADSDVVWDRFLPSNYKQILLRSISDDDHEFSSTKKDLYLHLIHDPILIDGGTKIFSLDKSTGKIRYTLCARELSISDGNNPSCWSWKSLPESRFSEVTILRSVSSLEIHGKIKTSLLSPKTTYGAYLIVRFEEWAYGLDSIPSELLVEDGNNNNVLCRGIAYLRRRRCNSQKQQLERLFFLNRMEMLRSKVMEGGGDQDQRVVHDRDDGWMEIELGEFYINNNINTDHDDKEIKMSLMEVKGNQLKGGLIVEGIEVRPIVKTGTN